MNLTSTTSLHSLPSTLRDLVVFTIVVCSILVCIATFHAIYYCSRNIVEEEDGTHFRGIRNRLIPDTELNQNVPLNGP